MRSILFILFRVIEHLGKHFEEGFFSLCYRWEKWDSNEQWIIAQDHTTAISWNGDFKSGVCTHKSHNLNHYILLSLYTTCNNFAIVLSW